MQVSSPALALVGSFTAHISLVLLIETWSALLDTDRKGY